MDARNLVFIDECGSTIAFTRVYARSPKGKRVYGAVPRNRRANITLLAALSLQGRGEAFILEGSADTAVFDLSVEPMLAPSLQAGQIVILDNLSTHTGEKVLADTLEKATQEAGHTPFVGWRQIRERHLSTGREWMPFIKLVFLLTNRL